MADKKKITLRDLHDLLDEQDAMTKRVTLFFATDGTDELDGNEVWLSGEVGLAFADWIVTRIGYAGGGLEIIIDKPEEKSNA